MKVKFSFPQIVFEFREVEVEDDSILEAHYEDQANFILRNMTETERSWLPLGHTKSERRCIENFLDFAIKIEEV